MANTDLLARIDVDFQRYDGKPFIKGTKPVVKVGDILDLLAAGQNHAEVLARFPKITIDDVKAAVAFSAEAARAAHSTLSKKIVAGAHAVPAPDRSRRWSKVLIIGSGPAGYTAAIYAARANLQPIMLEGATPGGQLMITTDVENYPGFAEGVTGPDMMAAFRAQAARFGTLLFTDNAVDVDVSKRPFKVVSDNNGEFTADALIIATGAKAKYLGLPNETRLYNKGVSACATCDGFLFRGKDVAVVGGGDTAMEEANYLTRHAATVTVIHRRPEFRASRIMVDRAKSNPKIRWKLNKTVTDVVGDDSVRSLTLKDTVDGKTEDFRIDGLFLAIGHEPNTAIFKGKLKLDESGYIVTKGKSSYTDVEGVFACGDVQDHVYRQAITAAGSGCTAAIDAERWLELQHE